MMAREHDLAIDLAIGVAGAFLGVFVADFLGESNLIAASIESITDGVAIVRTPDGTVVRTLVSEGISHKTDVKVMVRPEAVQIAASRSETKNSLPGIVRDRIFVGQATRYVVATAGLASR